ncbi:TldD/PmbA family protein [Candidatus Bipolaricaulota sp. J31]
MGILEKAAAAAKGAELYEEYREGISVSFRGGELEKVKSEAVLGRALRVIVDGRLGFASTAGEAEDPLVEAALASARHGDPAPFSFPRLEGGEPVEVLDPEVRAISVEDLLSWGEAAVRAVREEFPEVIVDVTLYRGETTVRIANTAGGEREERRTYFGMSVEAQRINEGDIWLLWVGKNVRRREDLSPEDITAQVIRYLRWGERVVPAPVGKPPVLFTPRGAVVLYLPLLVGFSGLSVYLGTSPLKGRLGEKAFDRRLTLVDRGTLPFGPRSASFDDEGIPTGTLPLVEEGVVRGFFYDLRAAALAGVEPTGNGVKGGLFGGGFRSPPTPGPRNILVSPGEGTLEELIAEMEEGIVVEGVLGLGQGNIQSGAFSNNVSTGFVVRDGRVIGRLKNTMIAGNAYEVLRDGLRAIGGEPEWCYGFYNSPPLLVEGVSVVTR